MKIIRTSLQATYDLARRLGATDSQAVMAAVVAVETVASCVPMTVAALIAPVGFGPVTRVVQASLLYGYLGLPVVQKSVAEWSATRFAAQAQDGRSN